ncbi:MAG: diguanylate cyclase [Burkholderiales bacterium]|nr:diguanylate cyclase [Burkholderiales bacterium]
MKTSKGKAKLRLAEDAPPPHSPTEPPPAASSPPTTGKALAGRGKGFARRIYRLRTMGCAIGFFCVAGVFRQLHAAPWLWALLVFHGYLWPHLAYRLALRARVPYRGERRNLMIDAAFGGFWVVAMRFNLLPSLVLITMLSMDDIGAGGLALFWRGLIAHAAGAVVGAGVLGLHVAPTSDMFNIVTCLPMLVLYPIALGQATYEMSQKLAQRTRELEYLNQHDGLTGLFSRFYWEVCLARTFDECLASGRPACLIMLDLDHFKQINDTHGHLAGDLVLQKFAGTLRESLRSEDIIGRYGGEEFGVILPGVNADQAEPIIDRLLARLRAQTSLDREMPPGCTASAGIVAFSAGFPNPDAWLQQADHALYQAKRLGRDRLVVC